MIQLQDKLEKELAKITISYHVVGKILLGIQALLDYDMTEFDRWREFFFDGDVSKVQSRQFIRLAKAFPEGSPINMSMAGLMFLLRRKHTRYFKGALALLVKGKRKRYTLKHAQHAILHVAESLGTGFVPRGLDVYNLSMRLDLQTVEKIDELKEILGYTSRVKVVEKAIDFFYEYQPV